MVRQPQHRQARGEHRRAALLRALEAQLQERVLADISVASITREAGVARSAFYFYFPNRFAAVAELLLDVYDELFTLGSDLVEGIGPPRAGLFDIAGHTVAVWRRNRKLFCAMLDAVAADPDVRPVWDGWLKRFEDQLVHLATRQRWPLALPDGVDLREAMAALLDMTQGVLDRHLREETDRAAAERVAALIAHTWIATLLGSDPSARADLRPVDA